MVYKLPLGCRIQCSSVYSHYSIIQIDEALERDRHNIQFTISTDCLPEIMEREGEGGSTNYESISFSDWQSLELG